MSEQISPNTITATSSKRNAKPVPLDMTMFTQPYDSEEDTRKDRVEDNDEETANADGRETPMPPFDDSAESSGECEESGEDLSSNDSSSEKSDSSEDEDEEEVIEKAHNMSAKPAPEAVPEAATKAATEAVPATPAIEAAESSQMILLSMVL